MYDVERRNTGAIERRLSSNSFITNDPASCAQWLRDLNWQDEPVHSRSEHARLSLIDATAICYTSGLLIMLVPGVATLPGGAQ